MVATLIKEEVENAVVVDEKRLINENKVVLKGAADAMAVKASNAGMDSVYGKVIDDMCP